MDATRLRQLAGLPPQHGNNALYIQLNEVVQINADASIEDICGRLDACKRALKIANTLSDPIDKKKWLSAVFVNLNKVRAALQRALVKLGAEQPDESGM